MKWHCKHEYGCMVYTECVPRWKQFTWHQPGNSHIALLVHHFSGHSKPSRKKATVTHWKSLATRAQWACREKHCIKRDQQESLQRLTSVFFMRVNNHTTLTYNLIPTNNKQHCTQYVSSKRIHFIFRSCVRGAISEIVFSKTEDTPRIIYNTAWLCTRSIFHQNYMHATTKSVSQLCITTRH